LQVFSVINVDQFASSSALNIFRQLRGSFAKKDFLCFIRSKGFNHSAIVSRRDSIFKSLFIEGGVPTVCVSGKSGLAGKSQKAKKTRWCRFRKSVKNPRFCPLDALLARLLLTRLWVYLITLLPQYIRQA